jgi:hypothetical protein
MMISGNNFQSGRRIGAKSYYFSCYAHIWGWATWRRAWQHYDLKMRQWPSLRNTSWLRDILKDRSAVKHWRGVLDSNYQGQIDSWDIQWMFACWTRNGLAILPNKNLVSNIGFGEDATHTRTDIYGVAEMPVEEMEFPLEHPAVVGRDEEADSFTFKNIFAKENESNGVYRRIGRRLLASLPDSIRESIVEFRARMS